MTTGRTTYNLRGLIITLVLVEVIFWVLALWYRNDVIGSSPEFRFEEPNYLYTLIALPVLSILFYILYFWKNRSFEKLANIRLLSSILPASNTFKAGIQYSFFRFGVGLILIALANPQYGKEKRAGIAKGIEIMVALDVSNSMYAKDDKRHSRLDIAKRALNKLLEDELGSDKIGLVIFAGQAYKHTPLTTDYTALSSGINMVEPYMLSAQGTNISEAIETALTSFNENSQTNKAVIVVSDGENHEEDAVKAAEDAYKEHDVRVYTIGMGDPAGTAIPVYNQRQERIGFKKDRNGQTVVSKLNEQNLINIAENGGGTYTKANFVDLGLSEIVSDINTIEKKEFGKTAYEDYEDHFYKYLLLGFFLCTVSIVIETSNSSTKRSLNLFDA